MAQPGAPPSTATPAARPKDEFADALRQCLPLFWTAAVFSGGVNLLFLASPLYLMQMYNRVIPSGSTPTLVTLSAALFLALATMLVLDAVRARLLTRAAARLDRLLSQRVFQTIVDLSMLFGAGARNAQPLRDLDQFRSAMAGPAAQLFFDGPWTPLFLVVLFILHPLLGVVGLFGALLLLGLAAMNDMVTRESTATSTEAATRSYVFTENVVRHADPVHAMGMLDDLAGRWRVDRETMIQRQTGGGERNADFAAAIRFARLALQGCMLGVGALLVIEGKILPASIFAASLLLGRALAPLEVAVTGWRQLSQALAAGRRVQKALNAAPPALAAPTRLPPADGRVRAAKAVYVPPGAKTPALRNIRLDIAAGEAVGVVGPSGAGKSSLARLLVAAARPTSGKVTIGGVDTARWTPKALSMHVGYLPQNVGLFPGTVRDNIGRFREATDEHVVAAAIKANVHEMIMALPQGYETPIHEGGLGLSGGQRQRIGLARALFGAPRLLVLDEPNAHLDAEGERALAEALAELKAGGCTIVIVAHRLNPLSQVDRVIVLNQGTIEMDGPRSEVFGRVRTEVVRSFAPQPAE
ncbi:type I secretion system permease/ATPase [Caulobacter endophyticus]|uniref:Type I secretion system permease/ATPase n=1 Tax=Caulobacter endophyticus TaxID=2172652 RepID=A0A2T9K429_9CAUL|nr:type I secretion system permease/ATPase [Caulobacter endophyticus]PVM90707.1 type I secretion system permease/ATPase [Caulobacter endophyticus]